MFSLYRMITVRRYTQTNFPDFNIDNEQKNSLELIFQ